jgi:NAD(P)-dependent dehydrogenase (short-subunit alcohol dehydrogenase family)
VFRLIEATTLLAEATEAIRALLATRAPLGRTGTPKEVAGVVAFLASHASLYMTGQPVRVQGGAHV